MSEQNPYGAVPPPPAQPPYDAPPPPAQPPYDAPPPPAQPPYDAPPQQEPWAAVPPQPGAPAYPGGEYPPAYPGAEYAGYPGYPVQPPKKSRKALWIVLGCVGGVILLVVGLLGWFILDTASNTGTRKVVLPETFQGLNQDHSNPVAQTLQSSIQDTMSKGSGGFKATAVSALYTGTDSGSGVEKAVIVFGGYGNVLLPSVQIDEFYKGAGSQGTASISGRQEFDPGPLGGKLSCAVMKAETETDSLCVWADGSSVVGVMTGKADSTDTPDLAQAAAAVRELRQTAEVKK